MECGGQVATFGFVPSLLRRPPNNTRVFFACPRNYSVKTRYIDKQFFFLL